ncbi:unnamed protein product, partial [Allacma fusca]
MNPFEEILQK